MRSIRPLLLRLFSLRTVSTACSALALVVLLRSSADVRALDVRLSAVEISLTLPAPSSPSSPPAAVPALPHGDAGQSGAGGMFDGLARSPAPVGWRYSIAHGRPCLVLPSGRFLMEGTACSWGIIRHILPDCVVTDSAILEFSTYDRRAI